MNIFNYAVANFNKYFKRELQMKTLPKNCSSCDFKGFDIITEKCTKCREYSNWENSEIEKELRKEQSLKIATLAIMLLAWIIVFTQTYQIRINEEKYRVLSTKCDSVCIKSIDLMKKDSLQNAWINNNLEWELISKDSERKLKNTIGSRKENERRII